MAKKGMKYAIFSDIHGNIYGLQSALADAKACNVDKFLFLGDYASNFPWGNEVADVLRNLEYASIIAGNGEGYLERLKNDAQQSALYEQFALVNWTWNTLSPENANFLTDLPPTGIVNDADTPIYLEHASSVFFRQSTPLSRIHAFHSRYYKNNLAGISQEEYLKHARDALLAREDAMAEVAALPAGIHLFGHNHLQWHAHIADKLFLNPGSVGEPLMGDSRATYTILTVEGNKWHVDERRVEYDLEAALTSFDNSNFCTFSPGWARAMRLTLESGLDYPSVFLEHLRKTAAAENHEGFPVPNPVWESAVASWAPT